MLGEKAPNLLTILILNESVRDVTIKWGSYSMRRLNVLYANIRYVMLTRDMSYFRTVSLEFVKHGSLKEIT